MRHRSLATAAIAGLAASAVSLALAPIVMPDGYSWVEHTTSESAAQGVGGGWLARLGFVTFGLSVLLLATACRRAWGPAGTWAHGAFGVLMIAAGTFSTRSWESGTSYGVVQDALHSVAATAMGFAFALGVLAVLVSARPAHRRWRWPLDLTALAASVLVPLAMLAWPSAAGAWQRVMFGVAYAWYLAEACHESTGGPASRRPARRETHTVTSDTNLRPV